MKILFILPWVPYPLDSGGNQAVFNMIDAIRKQHSVSLITYAHSSGEQVAADELGKVWTDVSIKCYSDRTSTIPYGIDMSAKDKALCNFWGWLERSMHRKIARKVRKYKQMVSNSKKFGLDINEKPGTSPVSKGFDLGEFVRQNSTLYRETTDLNQGFLSFVYDESRKGYDMVQVEFYEYLPLVYVLPANVRKVFVHHELRFIRNENEMSLFDRISIDDHTDFNKLKGHEIGTLSQYDDIITLTEIDKGILSQILPGKNIYVSPALTSASTITTAKTFRPGKDLVFLGGGGHFPNADGVLWFCMTIAPLLRSRGYDGTIYVAGKWNDDIQKLIHKQCPEIMFTGFVDDIYEFINGKITYVPIRIGSGMRMKIMDAMAAASPMVTTSKGCEGLPFENGTDCFIADDASSFADAIIRLCSDESLQQQMVTNTGKKMTSILDAEALLNRRLSFYLS